MPRRRKTPVRRPAAAPAAVTADSPCPCGLDDRRYGDCCGVFHAAAKASAASATGPAGGPPAPAPATAELLMRSRYSAFAVGDTGYLLRSWHSRSRPERLELDPAQRWVRLEVLDATDGGPFHVGGTVAFRAHWTERGEPGVLAETSRFVREGGAWVYLDGVLEPAP
ncbi:YchJ family protein [Streptacidiphilus cavernicola]|uniref:YchJ family protein n=1 Tax=Streptacidiphilus cavernicola TaxID=3342716 RepID=A0ABV6VS84_9ACTN